MISTKKHMIALAVTATMGLTACGGSSSPSPAPAPAPAPTPTPTNNAPTDITLSASAVAERESGAEIGTLTAVDADANDTFTFTVNDERFEVVDNTLKLKSDTTLDYETATSVDVTVTVADSADATFSKLFTVDVTDVLDLYEFESNIMPGESAVSYSGQTARHLLINDLTIFIETELGDITEFDTKGTFTSEEQVIAALNSYFDVADYEAVSSRALLTQTTPEGQATLADISSSSKNLVGKIAGNDATGQHKMWNDGDFEGWGEKGSTTPEALVRSWFAKLADNVRVHLEGTVRQDLNGNDITKLYLTEEGLDLKQLIQKFLLMSVAFSQGADDYLDNDVEGKGLLSNHTDTFAAYTDLEHQFDEGFGYFGAARNYLDYSDDEIAGKGGRDDWQVYHDTNGDGAIDFTAEYNFGQSTNAAKRDRGATVAIDLTSDAMIAFLQGRKLLNDTAGTELNETQMSELIGYRDTALLAWEKSIAATVVHYINDVNADFATLGTAEFNFANMAKHWAEMKAFSLGLQFNPHSPLVDEEFTRLQSLLGDAPPYSGEFSVYTTNLVTARGILADAYDFEEENVANW